MGLNMYETKVELKYFRTRDFRGEEIFNRARIDPFSITETDMQKDKIFTVDH